MDLNAKYEVNEIIKKISEEVVLVIKRLTKFANIKFLLRLK